MLVCFSLTLGLHRIRVHAWLLSHGVAERNEVSEHWTKRDRKEEKIWPPGRGEGLFGSCFTPWLWPSLHGVALELVLAPSTIASLRHMSCTPLEREPLPAMHALLPQALHSCSLCSSVLLPVGAGPYNKVMKVRQGRQKPRTWLLFRHFFLLGTPPAPWHPSCSTMASLLQRHGHSPHPAADTWGPGQDFLPFRPDGKCTALREGIPWD